METPSTRLTAHDPLVVAFAELFTDVPHVMFCIKDENGRYVAVNQAFADRAGKVTPTDVVGRGARELFPVELAESYERQDVQVLTSGQALRNELEMITRPDGSVGWYVTSKTRMSSSAGAIGIASVSVDLRAPAATPGIHAGVAQAVVFARDHALQAVSVGDVAAASGLTASQLERAVKKALGISAKQLLLRLRLEEALTRLRTTDASVAQIAHECGYYDQSAFTRQFKRVVGMNPGAYRSTHGSR